MTLGYVNTEDEVKLSTAKKAGAYAAKGASISGRVSWESNLLRDPKEMKKVTIIRGD